MRLTPADVHNVAFKKPSIGKRGYDEDEVDAFLDLVEAELSRLIEENNELTQRLATAQAGGVPTEQASQYEPEAAQQHVDQSRLDGDHEAPEASAPVSVQKAEPVAESATPAAAPAAPASSEAISMQAARLLGLAQETAERLTSEATTEAETTRSAAKAESEKLLGEATAEANRLLTDAQTRSESLLSEAMATSEALERDSRVRADALDRESQSAYNQAMGQLSEQRIVLERKIDDLRVYEREYRSRLKSWITDQLSQLDESGGSNNSEQYAQQGAE